MSQSGAKLIFLLCIDIGANQLAFAKSGVRRWFGAFILGRYGAKAPSLSTGAAAPVPPPRPREREEGQQTGLRGDPRGAQMTGAHEKPRLKPGPKEAPSLLKAGSAIRGL